MDNKLKTFKDSLLEKLKSFFSLYINADNVAQFGTDGWQ